jgi:hypothetical protein
MTLSSKYVGLDVHQATTIAAVGAAKAPKPTALVPAGKYAQLAGVDGVGPGPGLPEELDEGVPPASLLSDASGSHEVV